MNKKTKRRVQGVAIFIVFLALATTIFEIQRARDKGSVGFNFKPSSSEFRSMKWLNKAEFSLSSADTKKTMEQMDALVKSSALTTIRKDKQGAYGVYTFSVNKKDLDNVGKQLSSFGSIQNTSESIDTSLVSLDYDVEMANLNSYEKDLAELDKIRVPTDPEIRRKESIRRMINDTKVRLENLKNADSYLVYVTLKPIAKRSGSLGSVKAALVSFLKWLGIYFIALILVYYGTRLLMYLLALMGIKGLGMSGVGGAYTYGGYSSYSQKYSSRYGYDRGSKRKVKRVYKDKKSTPESETDTEPEDK